MDDFGQKWCRYFAFIIAAGICYGQHACEVIPKNLTVKRGSNVTVLLRAPSDSICRKNFNAFSPSKVFWTLNNKKIEEIFYTHNSTYAVVTIVNFTLQSGFVECHMQEQVLGGTIVRSQEPPREPVNIRCVTNDTYLLLRRYTICYWDETGNSQNTTYKVTMEQKEVSGHCISTDGQNHCRLKAPNAFENNLTVTVTAQNAVGNASTTVHFHTWEINKYDPPKGIRVKPLSNGLRVEWDTNSYHYTEEVERCEAQCVEEGTDMKSISNKTTPSERAILFGDVKPCTRYTVFVRCAYLCDNMLSLWSDWSNGISVTSMLNISTVPFYLWGNILESYANGSRPVQLMWKGYFCNAIDEYRISGDSIKPKHLKPTQHYETVVLDAAQQEITIAAYKNNMTLRHSSLKIPFSGKYMPPVQRPIATVHDGLIHVSWDAPLTPVKYYVIEWFTRLTVADGPSWNRTQDTNISFRGDLPYKLYTVTITALYDDGPGQRSTIHTYAKQGAPAKVNQVKKIDGDATSLTVGWEAVPRDQCCGFVVSYTVFYRVSTESKERQLNVTVSHTGQQVTLRDLIPSTAYQVHVRANSYDNSSDSEPHTFKTEAYGKAFIQTLVYMGIGLLSLLLVAVCIFLLRRKVLNLMVPNPQFSSMAMWSPEKSLKYSFSDNRGLNNKERILLCQVDTEMDTKMALTADTDSTSSQPMEDKTDSSTVAFDTSDSSGQAEGSGGTVFYSIWECQTKYSGEVAEVIHQQPDETTPSLFNPYLEQMPVSDSGGTLTGQAGAQGHSMLDEGEAGAESNEEEPLNSVPSDNTYVTVGMIDS